MHILRYFILAIALILWAGGLFSTVSHWLYEAGVIAEDYRYGDLYRLWPLPKFKETHYRCPSANRSSDTSSTHLYIIGDSFSDPKQLSESDFGVSHYQRVAWEFQQRAQLDTSKRNVLFIETVERHFRDHFAVSVNQLIVQNDTSQTASLKPTLKQRIRNELNLKNVNERLESELFGQDWALWFKEVKAELTLKWFDRDNGAVTLAKNQQHIFLNLDTDTTNRLNSSFAPLTDKEVNTLVDSVNATADRYLRLGFDEVYLSIVPNKATILEPSRGVYNHLIERVQANPRLKVPFIDTYSRFKKAPSSPYWKSDTHWNCDGRSIWLQAVYQKVKI
ncbi:hypothetical protein IC229_28305 [Spirosoma sp. BT702]|uniref:AlgX/AlgJ SGNH hydrolase-like domain-containing protein n=1 Tax=Spirosoma profusum TaxID=2771354 RepID=A0A927AUJ1_9BACT|nr:hypothetical protein [Spirosoma profusum]MBD2704577.1 hypothetical protein [Spirosoma profusum]